MSYQDIIERRRSIYALNDQLPITEDEWSRLSKTPSS